MKHAKAKTRPARNTASQADVRPTPVRTARTVDATRVPPYAMEALEVLLDAGKQAFLVGGFVRDALRGAPAHDIDMTTDALWYQTRDIFIERGYHVVETGAKHGTVTVFVGGQPIEITTFRTEGSYSDHRRPDHVRYVRDVEDDLARRDFTVNAIAWSPDRGVVDPFEGRLDIARGLVRAVGDPQVRFEEDALRVMRGVRFASKLGYTVEEGTSAAIHDRDGIVRGPHAVATLRAYPDVAAYAVPDIARMVGFDQRSKWHCYDVWEHCLHALELVSADAPSVVRHVTLLHDVGKPSTFSMGSDGRGHFYGHEEQGARMVRRIFENLHWRRADVERAVTLVRLHDHRIDPTPRGVRRVLSRLARSFVGAEDQAFALFDKLLQVKRADTLAHAPSCTARRMREIEQVEVLLAEVAREQTAFCLRDLAVKGSDLIAAGVPAGPAVGETLRALLARVVDGELPNERAILLAQVAGSPVSAADTPQMRTTDDDMRSLL